MNEFYSIEDFFKAVGFIPPAGKDVAYFVAPVEVSTLPVGFDDGTPSETGLSITYRKKDPHKLVSAAPTPAEYMNHELPADIPVQEPAPAPVEKNYTNTDVPCPFLNNIGEGTYLLTEPFGQFRKNTVFQLD